jgi:Glycosyl hydrolases family 35/Beta-galactosidase, domain 2/Beta-galactosidase second all-beta domain
MAGELRGNEAMKLFETNRRRFLQSVLGSPFAAELVASVPRLFAVEPQLPAEELFPNPHIIKYDAHCFTIQDKDAFLYGAAFHYARCPQALWRDRLTKLKAAGYNTIMTYIFWNYHEREEGHADFNQLESFIQLVKEMGLWLIARPGPYACAEWDSGGFPRWIIARRFPLRSNHPESVRTSQHWFSLVVPVIVRHQITHGGPIIMMQLENEYDFWPNLPDGERLAYVRSLAEAAWNEGIDVPLITCWTKQARENSDPTMARIMDTCNFYPRWNILKEVPPKLQELRKQETATPLGITELQGGWFSEFGGKLSVDQDGVTGAQYNLLTKTAIEQGVTYFSTYMAFGGTNFDWAAKNLTTTYDYAAPLREPGGLWEKFYAARGVGKTLSSIGAVLARAKRTESGVSSTNPNVTVTLRENGERGGLFIREDANAQQHYKMTFPDPSSPTRRPIKVPREGELVIGPREMKMLPVQLEIPGGAVRYSTAEVLTFGKVEERQYLILYDEPGRLAEISLATREEPHIEGDVVYQYWDEGYESVVFGVRFENAEKFLLLNHHQMIILLPREKALRTWTADFPDSIIPGPIARKGEEIPPVNVPFLTDLAMMGESGTQKYALWADLMYRPGEHDLTVLVPPVPSKCRVDGAEVDLQYDRPWRAARVHVSTPPAPSAEISLRQFTTWTEKFDPHSGNWPSGPLRALDQFGTLPYGYVKYRSEFPLARTAGKMFISAFDEDGKKVFLNGKYVQELSSNKSEAEAALGGYAQSGTNTLEIAYELFGGFNFGEKMGNLKGIESVSCGADKQSATAVNNWQVQLFPATMSGRELDPRFPVRDWKPAELSVVASGRELVPAFTWCRFEFPFSESPAGWWIPWKLVFEAERDALFYLNGKFLGRYVTIGPQKEFYLPENYLKLGGKSQNVLTIALAYAEDANHIRTLRIAPYEDFAMHRTRLELEW